MGMVLLVYLLQHIEVGRVNRQERITLATRWAPLEQLALSPQCGFASTCEGNNVSADDQWRKLKLVHDVARDVWK